MCQASSKSNRVSICIFKEGQTETDLPRTTIIDTSSVSTLTYLQNLHLFENGRLSTFSSACIHTKVPPVVSKKIESVFVREGGALVLRERRRAYVSEAKIRLRGL